MTLNVPLAGSSVAFGENLTVTVFAADTHAVKVAVAVIDALGTPNATTSPSAAPVTVIVRSATAPAPVLAKSSVADPLSVRSSVKS